jgi:hypothetical protein
MSCPGADPDVELSGAPSGRHKYRGERAAAPARRQEGAGVERSIRSSELSDGPVETRGFAWVWLAFTVRGLPTSISILVLSDAEVTYLIDPDQRLYESRSRFRQVEKSCARRAFMMLFSMTLP